MNSRTFRRLLNASDHEKWVRIFRSYFQYLALSRTSSLAGT